jgi:hypothetical protein
LNDKTVFLTEEQQMKWMTGRILSGAVPVALAAVVAVVAQA